MKRMIAALLLLVSLKAGAQTKEVAVGCWKMPSIAGELLELKADGSFSFYDLNSLSKELEHFYGSWKKQGKTITLMYDDRPQQRFFLYKDKKGQWRLRKAGGFRFVKGKAEDCSGAK